MPDLTSLFVDRASLGVTATTAPSSVLRLGTLAAPAVGASRLAVDASGNVTAGVLVPGDIPSAFTRRDVAEVISQPWIWNITGQGAPSQTSRSAGTRLVMFPVAASTEYAIGIEGGALWQSVPPAAQHKWYTGATERLKLASDGALHVINGNGYVYLAAAGDGGGVVQSAGNMLLSSGGVLTFNTFAGVIQPLSTYRENLGGISRKWLSVHAAELWVETLVAQNTLATIGGRILVGPTTTLTRDCAPGDTTIWVKHNAFSLHLGQVEYGSKLILESGGKFEVMVVYDTVTPAASASGDYGYWVGRAYGGSAWHWYAGDAVFDSGTQKAPAGAFMDLYSVRGVNPGSTAGPTIVGNVRVGQSAVDWQERWAIGQLKGLYGNSAAVFGAAFGLRDGIHLQIDATNGIRMLAGVTVFGQWAMNGDVSFGRSDLGQLTFSNTDGTLRMKWAGVDRAVIASDGSMRLATDLIVGAWGGVNCAMRSGNAGAFNSGWGFYFSADATTGVTTALIGNSAGRRIQWDGTSLKVITDGMVLDEQGITMLQNGGTTVTPGRLIRFGTTGGYLWDTTATPGAFAIVRSTGNIEINAQAASSLLILRAAGAGITCDQYGTTLFGTWHLPAADAAAYMGGPTRRFHSMYSNYLLLGHTKAAYYHIELLGDSAAKPTTSTWVVTSDARTKRDVRAVDRDDALALVRRVPIVRFIHNGEFDTPEGVEGIGVVAQELAPILPASVAERTDSGALTWNAHELLMLNVAAVQALAARLDRLDDVRH